MKASYRRFLPAFLLLTAVLPAIGHHAWSSYFEVVAAPMSGVVTRIDWENPHVYFHLDAVGEDGKTESWIVETLSINTLSRRGLTRESIRIGDRVAMVVSPEKPGANFDYLGENLSVARGSRIAMLREITLPNGGKILLLP